MTVATLAGVAWAALDGFVLPIKIKQWKTKTACADHWGQPCGGVVGLFYIVAIIMTAVLNPFMP